MPYSRSAREVFDDWAQDYHAAGMEDDHWPSVKESFDSIPDSGGRYLEVGVGNGYSLAFMAQHQFASGRCVGIDISSKMVENARRRTRQFDNVEVFTSDFMDYEPGHNPPGHNPPDLIFSMEVFYYLSDILAGLRHAFEILAPGGTLMVLVNHYRERLDSHEWPDQLDTPMQLWSGADYVEAFKKTGFLDVTQRYVGVPQDEAVRSYNPGTLETVGRKPL